jgi:NitT/TauT family transport system substrate-binding protein
METRIGKRGGIAVLAALLALASPIVAAVCAPQAGAQELQTWRHGMLEAKSDAGILMMITRHDFAKKYGLKIEISQFKSDVPEVQAAIAGEIDSFEGGVPVVITADAHGADIRVIGCHWPGLPHGIFTKASVTSIAQLKGKTFAISAPGAMPDTLVRTVLAQNHISPNDVTFANLGSDLDRYKALQAGVVDAAVVSGEYAPIAQKEGLKLLVRGQDALPNFMRICFMTGGTVLNQKRGLVVAFLAAEMDALHYALAHKDETVALTQELTGTKPDDPRPAFIFDQAKNGGVDPTLAIPVGKLDWMQQQMVQAGTLPQPIDLSKYVAPDVRADALKRAAK